MDTIIDDNARVGEPGLELGRDVVDSAGSTTEGEEQAAPHEINVGGKSSLKRTSESFSFIPPCGGTKNVDTDYAAQDVPPSSKDDSEKLFPVVDAQHLDATTEEFALCVTDLVIETAHGGVNRRRLDSIGLLVTGLGNPDEKVDKISMLRRVSSGVWKQNAPVKIPTNFHKLLILAGSNEGVVDMIDTSLTMDDLDSVEPGVLGQSNRQILRAYTFDDGAPISKLSFKITDIPLDETTEDFGDDQCHQSGPAFELGWVQSPMTDTSSPLNDSLTVALNWDNADGLVGIGASFFYRFQRTGDLSDISQAISAYRRAVQLTPQGHARMPYRLNDLGTSLCRRFEHSDDLSDITDALSSYQMALQLTPHGHPNMAMLLNNVGSSFSCRFRHTGDVKDISHAISAHQKAVQVTADDHSDMSRLLEYLGDSILCRFEHAADLSDITDAIAALQRSVHLTPHDHTTMPDKLTRLGRALARRFEHTNNLSDISSAISALQRAVQLTPDRHPDPSICLNNLGNSFSCRFGHTGDLCDLSGAISANRRAVQLIPEDHSDMRIVLNSLGSSLLCRFERAGDLTDISESISAHQKAVQLTPDGHSDMPVVLNSLGNSLRSRFERTGNLADISEAISAHQKAVQLLPDGRPALPLAINSLGTSLWRRFEHTGDQSDILNAISAHQRAVELTPHGHANMPSLLNSLGNAYMCSFNHSGDPSDISNAISVHQKAVQLTPDCHAAMPDRLSDLGLSFAYRFEHAGDLADISNCVSAQQRAVKLTPCGHANQSRLLSNLGESFQYRYRHTGDALDISNAISALQRAVQLMPHGHVDMPAMLSNLGNSLLCRFERTSDLPDIFDAISAHQRAVELTPDHHPDLPGRLNNLGNSYARRFSSTHDVSDVCNAISSHQRAVQISPRGHAGVPGRLNNLGNSFLCRFLHTRDLTDLSNAISAHEKAVQLTSDGSASKPERLNNLGESLVCRFQQTTALPDLSDAISVHQRAVQLTPHGHANLPVWLNSLGNSFWRLFRRTGNIVDIHEAASNYRLSATHITGTASIRLNAARRWAEVAIFQDPLESLRGYDVALQLLSEVAGFDRTIQQRQTSLVDISSLTSSAASLALSLDEVSKALEWLEQGRCLVWNQLNQLRTPVDDLRAHDECLAKHFSELSGALESFGSRRETRNPAIEVTMSEKIALEQEAQTHVRRAQEWRKLLVKIRGIPAFHDFLQPRQAPNILKNLPRNGTVVFLTADESRPVGDALALVPGCEKPLHIPLKNFTHKEASGLKNRLRRYLKICGRGPREVLDPSSEDRREIHEILQELWLHVVRPILDGLGYSDTPSSLAPARIWWCATGPLAFLPIHAAGIYGQDTPCPGSCVSDFVVSSYTPTVSVLLDKVKSSDIERPPSKVLLVSQPNAPDLPPIPGTTREIDALSSKFDSNGCEFLRLDGSIATVDRVKQEMESYNLIHFACHASQNVAYPLKSGFYLHDGRLELSEIMKRKFPRRELAFLSACQTSTGDENLSDEAVHLAAGMLAAGYQGVVATMWSIRDKYAPEIAENFYEYLMEKGKDEKNTRLKSADAAHALHHTIQCFRRKMGDREDALLTWVPYVHFGL